MPGEGGGGGGRLPLFGMLSEGLHLVGACAFSDETYRTAVSHLAAGRAPVERLVSERVSLDETPDALVRLRAPGTLVRIISRPWQLDAKGSSRWRISRARPP